MIPLSNSDLIDDDYHVEDMQEKIDKEEEYRHRFKDGANEWKILKDYVIDSVINEEEYRIKDQFKESINGDYIEKIPEWYATYDSEICKFETVEEDSDPIAFQLILLELILINLSSIFLIIPIFIVPPSLLSSRRESKEIVDRKETIYE